MPKYAPGDTVTWTSRSYHGSKTGKVLAVLPKLADPFEGRQELREHRGRCHFDQYSLSPRYLIEVERKHARTGAPLAPHFYAPLQSVVDRSF